MGKGRTCLLIIVGVISAILFIVLMSLSFKNVGFDEVSLKYHKVARKVSDTIYEQGKRA
jgi:uncharacterized membrane protein YgaE (UPF0421/DUF939 family)